MTSEAASEQLRPSLQSSMLPAQTGFAHLSLHHEKEWQDTLDRIYQNIHQIQIDEGGIRQWLASLDIPTQRLLPCIFAEVKPDESLPAAITYGSKW